MWLSFLTKDGNEIPNRQTKRKLVDIFKVINEKTDLNFTVKWGKKKDVKIGRWNYEPHFYFDEVEAFDNKGQIKKWLVTNEKKEEKA